jgi:hypothetical protein
MPEECEPTASRRELSELQPLKKNLQRAIHGQTPNNSGKQTDNKEFPFTVTGPFHPNHNALLNWHLLCQNRRNPHPA